MKSHPHADNTARQPATGQSRTRPWRRRWVWVGASAGAVVLIVALFVLVFGGTVLSRYGKARAERAYAEAYPGSVLRIGELDYAVGANRLVAQRVTLSAANATFEAGRIELMGVRWRGLLWGHLTLADGLARANLEATDLQLEFPGSHYRIHCARLRGSVPASELMAQETELRPSVGDEELFAADAFRTTRFRVSLAECAVLGLDYGGLLAGKAYRAGSVHLSRPAVDALINRDKPPAPFLKSPLMVHEALAAIRQRLQVDRLTLTNGLITYAERALPGAEHAVLTFGAVSGVIEGLDNRGAPAAAVELQAQADLMNAATLKVQMSIPIAPPNLALHYSGSLSAMDLTRLGAFLDLAEYVRVRSGSAQEAAFEIEVVDGQARGRVQAIYADLKVAVLDQQTGSEKGFDNRVTSFLANFLKVRTANAPDASGSMREGAVDYMRADEDEFLEFLWLALWSGVRDVITH
jgi:hypothetical protein